MNTYHFILLLIFSFFKGLTIAVLEISIDSLFVIGSSPDKLTYLYIVIDISTMVIGTIYSFFEQKLDKKIICIYSIFFTYLFNNLIYTLNILKNIKYQGNHYSNSNGIEGNNNYFIRNNILVNSIFNF